MVEHKTTSFDEKLDQPAVLRSTSSGDSSSDDSHSPKDRVVASGVTGAVLGFLFGGPIGSALFGFGAAYVSKKDGAPGDAARALGDVGITIKDKAIEVDEKHHIVEKTSKVATGAWDGAKKYDEKHHILDNTKEFAIHNWQSFVNFINERRILQKGVDGFGRGYEFIAEKVGSCGKNTTSDEATTTK